eukprot:6214637-Pleurochrysis_carterae.AAC.2
MSCAAAQTLHRPTKDTAKHVLQIYALHGLLDKCPQRSSCPWASTAVVAAALRVQRAMDAYTHSAFEEHRNGDEREKMSCEEQNEVRKGTRNAGGRKCEARKGEARGDKTSNGRRESKKEAGSNYGR